VDKNILLDIVLNDQNLIGLLTKEQNNTSLTLWSKLCFIQLKVRCY